MHLKIASRQNVFAYLSAYLLTKEFDFYKVGNDHEEKLILGKDAVMKAI